MAYKRISPQPVNEGGTGAQTLTGVLTGNGTSAITANAITEHGVLFGGSSNAVDSTSVGTAGQLLTSNGAGVDPTFQDAAPSAAWEFLSSQTASSSASIEFTSVITTNALYYVSIRLFTPATSTAFLTMQVSQNNGSSWIATGYGSGVNYSAFNSATINNANSTTAFRLSGPMVNTSQTALFNVYFSNTNIGSIFRGHGSGTWVDSGLSNLAMGSFCGASSTGINAVRFLASSGNISSGVFSLYRAITS